MAQQLIQLTRGMKVERWTIDKKLGEGIKHFSFLGFIILSLKDLFCAQSVQKEKIKKSPSRRMMLLFVVASLIAIAAGAAYQFGLITFSSSDGNVSSPTRDVRTARSIRQSPSKDVKTAVSPTFTAGGTIVPIEQPSDDVKTATSPVYTHGGQVADADHDKTSDDVKTARSPVYNKEPEPSDSQTSNSVQTALEPGALKKEKKKKLKKDRTKKSGAPSKGKKKSFSKSKGSRSNEKHASSVIQQPRKDN